MRKNALGLALACALLGVVRVSPVRAANGPPVFDVDEHTLQEKYNIPPTKEGLLMALRHSRPDVRMFAALKLAWDGQKDAIPSILAALAVDPVPNVKVSMAFAAAKLGSEDGLAALRSMCHGRTSPSYLRMDAAGAMLDLERNDCLTDVLEVMRSTEGSDSVEENQAVLQAVSLIPRFKSLTLEQLGQVRSIVPAFLRSSFPWMRATVCSTLRMMGGPWAAEQLRTALAAETDDNVRRAIKSSLAAMDGR